MKKNLFILIICALSTSCQKVATDYVWTDVSTSTQHKYTAVTFVDDNIGFAVGGDRYSLGMISRTFDGGNNWSSPDSITNKILTDVFALDDQRIFAVGYDSKFLRSSDGGATWEEIQLHSWMMLNSIFFVDDSIGIAVGESGYEKGVISRTTDGGNTWIDTLLDFSLKSVVFTDKITGFAAGYGRILKTTDAGLTWKATSARGDYFTGLCYTGSNTCYVSGYQGMILRTENHGENWEKVRDGNGVAGKRVHLEGLKFLPSGFGAAAANDGSIFISEGGSSWLRCNSPAEVDFKGIHLFDDRKGIVVGERGAIWKFEKAH